MLVLLVGLTVSHIISMTIYSGDRVESLSKMGGRHMAQRIANVSHLISESPPEWREKIVSALNEPSFQVFLSPKSMLVSHDDNDWRSNAIRNFVKGQLKNDSVRQVIVQMLDDTKAGRMYGIESPADWMQMHMNQMMHGVPPHQSLRISIELGEGQWLNFTSAIPEAGSFWSRKSILSMLSMAVAVILLSVWVVRRLTKPLGGFAKAAERLGRDVNAPPLPETGPIELRQASRAFNEMQERLQRFIENRTRMLAAISHDLRTPITLLRLRAELIKDAEERTKTMATLDEMESMIASTLAFVREDAESEESRTVDVAALLQSLCDDMSDRGLPVKLETPERALYECRPTSLKRALSNLVDNAVNYGGNADVRMEDRGDALWIVIEDNGPGIPDDEMEQVFAPFYRLEPSRNPITGGIGLGLSIVQTVIHAHGGKIALSNREQGGLRVSIELPY
ncbi:MAG TPA: HAMP domain-containing protein [Rhodospirillales bacterium]|nr:HAMP domain-containing protein [Rhodospirillales bacterium]